MRYSVAHRHAAHLRRRGPRIGAVINPRQNVAVNVDHKTVVSGQ
jgi:hypothetical protein